MLATVFPALAPRPELAEEMKLFAPLIGSWDLVVEDVSRDGSIAYTDGEWHFGWALDGRAVADVWISPSRAVRENGGNDGEWGLSLRFYDPSISAWRSTWHGPLRGWVLPFRANPSQGGITLEGERDGAPLRWIFSDIEARSFRWRAEEGGSGAVRQRFVATRRD